MSAAALTTARQLIAARFPDALPAAQRSWSAVRTGLGELDELLPSGGFQRGRLSSWRPGVGAAALLRSAAVHAVGSGERAVWVDGTRSITGAVWPAGPMLVRPADRTGALRATVELARSGGFALVVLDGLDPDQTGLVRLSRAAHEGGAALVILSRATSLATLRVRSHARVPEYVWRRSRIGDGDDVERVRVQVETRASGWLRQGTLSLALRHHDLRLSLDSALPDRRGTRR